MATSFLDEYKDQMAEDPQMEMKYVPEGDCLVYFMNDHLCHAERLTDLVTIFIADDDGELVGFEIKGVRRMLEQYKSFGVTLHRRKVQIGILFVLAGVHPGQSLRHDVFDAPLAAQEIEVPELVPA